MTKLEILRQKISENDEKIIALFTERMDLSLAVAQEKSHLNLPVFDPAREGAVLEFFAAHCPKYPTEAQRLAQILMVLSKELQKQTMINLK